MHWLFACSILLCLALFPPDLCGFHYLYSHDFSHPLGFGQRTEGRSEDGEETGCDIFSPVSLLQEYGYGSSQVPLGPLLVSGGPLTWLQLASPMLTLGCLPKCC